MNRKSDMRYCINCDNKHGCKSGTPPCIADMVRKKITGKLGKDHFVQSGQAARCRVCAYFRSCWKEEDYDCSVT